MNNIQTTAIIRGRGQLTIPDVIRRAFDWTNAESVVKITYRLPKEIVITPYIQENIKTINWKEIWQNIGAVRSFKSKQGSLSKFIIEDRHNH